MTEQTLNQTMTEARRALDAGRPEKAAEIIASLPGAARARPELRLLSGMVAAAQGDDSAAGAAFEEALAAAPKEPVIWLELALHAARTETGRAFAKRARGAGLAPALLTMVGEAAGGTGARARGAGGASKRDLAALSARADAGDVRGAEAIAAPLLKAKPSALVWAMLGQARLRAGASGPAADAFRQGLRLEPYAADLRLGLVQALVRAGKAPLALAEARRAAQHAPGWIDAQLALARLALALGTLDIAAEASGAAVRLAPRSDGALAVAAQVALAQGRAADAMTFAGRRKNGAKGRDRLLGQAAAAARQSEVALTHLGRAIEAAPSDQEARVARAQLLQSLGRVDEAEADLRDVLSRSPGNGTAARALAYGARLDASDPAVTGMQAALAKASPSDARLLDYALARVFEKSDAPAAFGHLRRANAATAKAFPHMAQADQAELGRLQQKVWPVLDSLEGTSTCAGSPIFVTGLPRSGTTLIEAILAAHSTVRAGGEMGAVQAAIAPLDRLALEGRADAAALTAAGQAYLEAVAQQTGQSDDRRVTDKSIHSFARIGPILRALPQAKIVVVHRDPRDTGLSIWRNHFRDGTHRYASSWDGIADHMALFRDALTFWRQALPKGSFHEIRYEDLLDDPEGQARALLDHAALEWEAGVLDFHNRAERVDTLSFAQVRQPLYASSRGAWEAHAGELSDFIAALKARDLLPEGA